MHDNPESSTLYHHGVKGQRWGIRRHQDEMNDTDQSARKSSTAGAVAGAAAGIGVGVLATYIRNRNRHYIKAGNQWVDKNSGRPKSSVILSSISLTTGLAFVGGYLGKKIAEIKDTKEERGDETYGGVDNSK